MSWGVVAVCVIAKGEQEPQRPVDKTQEIHTSLDMIHHHKARGSVAMSGAVDPAYSQSLGKQNQFQILRI